MLTVSPITSVMTQKPEAVRNIESNTVTSIWSNPSEYGDFYCPLDVAKKNIALIPNSIVENTGLGFEINLNEKQERELEKIKAHYEKYKDRYIAVSKETGVPPELVCTIHYLEGHLDFDTYLHNGQKLGSKTTIVPKGVFFKKGQWHEAAVDALKRKREYITSDFAQNLEAQLRFTESYNGFGYSNMRKKNPQKYGDLYSPYVYAGTSLYSKGLFVRDGVFDPNYVFKGVGTAVILDALKQV